MNWLLRFFRHPEWDYHGTGLMRRYVNGKWEYRPQTEEEAAKWQSIMAW